MSPPSNTAIARLLQELARRLEVEGVRFKPAAYRRAATSLLAQEHAIADVYARAGVAGLDTLPGIGRGIAARLEELLRTGSIAELERLRRDTPAGLLDLIRLPRVGPRRARMLYDRLGVRSLADLEAAAGAGRLRGLPRIGERTEKAILDAVRRAMRGTGSLRLDRARALVADLAARARGLPAVASVTIAGGVRRGCERVTAIDLVATCREAGPVLRGFAELPDVAVRLALEPDRCRVRLETGIEAELRVTDDLGAGVVLLLATGSEGHVGRVRELALGRGVVLDPHGLRRAGERVPAPREEDVYAAAGLPWIAPELREDAGEIAAAIAGTLPVLVGTDDIQGDLQIQTDWTDGSHSIERMAIAAREIGLSYIAITDHTRDLAMVRGNDEQRLLEQLAEVRRVDAALTGVRVLAGAEVNIRVDGTLDIEDAVLAQLDVVGAAIHSHFRLSREEQTRRVVRAIENPHVDILFHPTCRNIGRRDPIDMDFDAVLEAARRTGTVLEIDAFPDRLDLDDALARRAIQAGVRLAVDSDAHRPSHLRYLREYGVTVARRAWARKEDVVNCLPVEGLLGAIKGRSCAGG